ncbi:isoprenoid biosynthesis protein ElbB [Candidatus Endobugula sertula]|uniref:Glyoxalase n=1 Tax=Candidatus Endobugula sertula TaxID=62101 RepID=A0A1D2QT75_9GAMM|nr:isoprenoid biosynthesis protein ElbB [Candidatus Endobugula sertula]
MCKVAVVLSGCGVYDGAEINETVLTLLSLEENGIQYQCFAPDIEQYHVINHLTGEETNGKRNVLQEASRIVRGNCKPLKELNAADFDGLLVPGGFGVAKNLSNVAFEGSAFTVNNEFLTVCLAFKELKKPAGYMCIAPALLGKIYESIHCTIGNDPNTATIIEKNGGTHHDTAVNEVIIDETNRVVTTSCYMLAENINQARSGIIKLVEALKRMF